MNLFIESKKIMKLLGYFIFTLTLFNLNAGKWDKYKPHKSQPPSPVQLNGFKTLSSPTEKNRTYVTFADLENQENKNPHFTPPLAQRLYETPCSQKKSKSSESLYEQIGDEHEYAQIKGDSKSSSQENSPNPKNASLKHSKKNSSAQKSLAAAFNTLHVHNQ